MLDAHLHLCKNLHTLPISNLYFLNATSQEDWKQIIKLHQKPFVRVFLGIHPWWVHTVSVEDKNWILNLSNYLTHSQINIGEIGLDNIVAKKNPKKSMEKQITVFRKQLELSYDLNKVFSVHAVHCWNKLFAELDRIFPHHKLTVPAIIHGFKGSSEILKRLISYGFDISFDPRMHHAPPKDIEVFLKCPAKHRLLETDAENNYHFQILLDHYKKSAALLNISVNQLITEVNQCNVLTELSD